MKVNEVLKVLENDGWYRVKSKSSHIQLKHDIKSGRVTVPYHGKNIEVPIKILKSIFKQSEIDTIK